MVKTKNCKQVSSLLLNGFDSDREVDDGCAKKLQTKDTIANNKQAKQCGGLLSFAQEYDENSLEGVAFSLTNRLAREHNQRKGKSRAMSRPRLDGGMSSVLVSLGTDSVQSDLASKQQPLTVRSSRREARKKLIKPSVEEICLDKISKRPPNVVRAGSRSLSQRKKESSMVNRSQRRKRQGGNTTKGPDCGARPIKADVPKARKRQGLMSVCFSTSPEPKDKLQPSSKPAAKACSNPRQMKGLLSVCFSTSSESEAKLPPSPDSSPSSLHKRTCDKRIANAHEQNKTPDTCSLNKRHQDNTRLEAESQDRDVDKIPTGNSIQPELIRQPRDPSPCQILPLHPSDSNSDVQGVETPFPEARGLQPRRKPRDPSPFCNKNFECVGNQAERPSSAPSANCCPRDPTPFKLKEYTPPDADPPVDHKLKGQCGKTPFSGKLGDQNQSPAPQKARGTTDLEICRLQKKFVSVPDPPTHTVDGKILAPDLGIAPANKDGALPYLTACTPAPMGSEDSVSELSMTPALLVRPESLDRKVRPCPDIEFVSRVNGQGRFLFSREKSKSSDVNPVSHCLVESADGAGCAILDQQHNSFVLNGLDPELGITKEGGLPSQDSNGQSPAPIDKVDNTRKEQPSALNMNCDGPPSSVGELNESGSPPENEVATNRAGGNEADGKTESPCAVDGGIGAASNAIDRAPKGSIDQPSKNCRRSLRKRNQTDSAPSTVRRSLRKRNQTESGPSTCRRSLRKRKQTDSATSTCRRSLRKRKQTDSATSTCRRSRRKRRRTDRFAFSSPASKTLRKKKCSPSPYVEEAVSTADSEGHFSSNDSVPDALLQKTRRAKKNPRKRGNTRGVSTKRLPKEQTQTKLAQEELVKGVPPPPGPGVSDPIEPKPKRRRALRGLKSKVPALKKEHANTLDWTKDQLAMLQAAHASVDPLSASFWLEVSALVDGKTAKECRATWFSFSKTPKEKHRKPKKTRASHPDDDLFQSTPIRVLGQPAKIDTGFCNAGEQRRVPKSKLGSGDLDKEEQATSDQGGGGAKRGYKVYLEKMRKDVTRTQKVKRKEGPVKAPKVVVGYDASAGLRARLTPRGTLKIKHAAEEEDSENDQDDDDDETLSDCV